MNNKGMNKIRIFVAAPEDLRKERESLESVVEGLDLRAEGRGEKKIAYEIIDWSVFAAPNLDDPIDDILNQLDFEDWDLFIGILWLKFDNLPVGDRQNKDSEYLSKTEKLFDLAYHAWEKRKYPRILLYRCHSYLPGKEMSHEQFNRVQLFFDRFKRDNRQPPVYKIFKDRDTFAQILMDDLEHYTREYRRSSLLSKEVETVKAENRLNEMLYKRLKTDEIKEIIFFGIDNLFHNTALRKYPVKKVKMVLDNYLTFTADILRKYRSYQVYWGVYGGVWLFWGENAHDRAVSAAIEIYNKQETFNSDKKLNPFKVDLKPRMAIHCHAVDIDDQLIRTLSPNINYISHLQKNGTPSGRCIVTGILYQKLGKALQEKLVYEREYDSHTLYSYSTGYGKKEPLSQIEFENILLKIKDRYAILFEYLRMVPVENLDLQSDAVRRHILRIYRHYDYFYQRINEYEINWDKGYFARVIEVIVSFLYEDERLFEEFEDLSEEFFVDGAREPEIMPLRKFIWSLRRNSVPRIRFLLEEIKRIEAGGVDKDRIVRELLAKKIEEFIEADEFKEESAFTELLLTGRAGVIEYIDKGYRDPAYKRLIPRLYKLAHFVLIEDINFQSDQRIFPVLVESKHQKTAYFKSIKKMLDDPSRSREQLIDRRLREFPVKPEELDSDIFHKCVLVGSRHLRNRDYIVNYIDWPKLWDIIAYHKTPLPVLLRIAERLKKEKNTGTNDNEKELINDRMKVFFDLTLSNLLNHIFTSGNIDSLRGIRSLIDIFYSFNFFDETGYFNRLNDLYLRFKTKSGSGLKIDIIETSRQKLHQEIETHGLRDDNSPQCFDEIPLPVLRKLAKEDRYMKWFSVYPVASIACEVKPYINSHNINLFLKKPELNGALLNELLKRSELFRKKQLILLAIKHPKCSVNSASLYASKISESDKKKFSVYHNINPAVKAFFAQKRIGK